MVIRKADPINWLTIDELIARLEQLRDDPLKTEIRFPDSGMLSVNYKKVGPRTKRPEKNPRWGYFLLRDR